MSDEAHISKSAPANSEHHWVQPDNKTIEANVDLYQLTYDEAKRTLDDQATELSNARGRAVQFMAFVGAATAFLAGQVVGASDNALFVTLAIIASLLGIAAIMSVGSLLNPWSTPFSRRVEPTVLIKTWIEREVPAPSKGVMLRELALHFEDFRAANEVRLQRVRILYVASIVLGAGQLLLWATLVWLAN